MKYELVNTTVHTFDGVERPVNGYYRIRALRDFGSVRRGDFGGVVSGFNNLSQEGDCWVYPGACVLHDAQVTENAIIGEPGYPEPWEDPYFGTTIVNCGAKISGNVVVTGKSNITGTLSGNVKLHDSEWNVKRDIGHLECFFVSGNSIKDVNIETLEDVVMLFPESFVQKDVPNFGAILNEQVERALNATGNLSNRPSYQLYHSIKGFFALTKMRLVEAFRNGEYDFSMKIPNFCDCNAGWWDEEFEDFQKWCSEYGLRAEIGIQVTGVLKELCIRFSAL